MEQETSNEEERLSENESNDKMNAIERGDDSVANLSVKYNIPSKDFSIDELGETLQKMINETPGKNVYCFLAFGFKYNKVLEKQNYKEKDIKELLRKLNINEVYCKEIGRGRAFAKLVEQGHYGLEFDNQNAKPAITSNGLLCIGDKSENDQVTIVDEDRLCYIVRSESKGAVGLRTISKAMLSEFVDYIRANPDATANDARVALSGKSVLDKIEYGYASTYILIAQMVLSGRKVNGKKEPDKPKPSIPLYISSPYRPYITAIKSKPFLLLAGISGTGKSRIVRELARACWDEDSEEYKAQKPRNFEMVQVKPNWHDSTELIGYVSRVNGKAEFVAGDFLKFVARAWQEPDVPYFLCLDEMNLAPVEQYFAEYLSVVESRKVDEDGKIKTDALLKKESEQWYYDLIARLTDNDEVKTQFLNEGIALPQNLIVVGTVNMDETTFSFSRKVLDRAMTIEMNEVNLLGGLDTRYETIGKLSEENLIGNAVEGVDVYGDNKEVCDKVIAYLQSVNDVLDKDGKPFKVAYRTRNEFLLYVVNNLPYCTDEDGNELSTDYVIARALDEITNMKVLPRIEGDDTKVTDKLLDRLKSTIEEALKALTGEEQEYKSVSIAKIDEMKTHLDESGYTSYWS